MKNGIVYIAFGKVSLKEAVHSVNSLKKIHKDLHITLLTDKEFNNTIFDNVIVLTMAGIRVKQNYLYDYSPYDNTLYLDSDTEIVGPILDIFDLMVRFDIAATHDLIRKDPKKSVKYPDYANIPDGFPEFGGGVVLFKKSSKVEAFFSTWRRNFDRWYELTDEIRDQPSFRVSLWECSDLHVHTLPPEFNIRVKNYNNIVPRINHQHNLWRKG